MTVFFSPGPVIVAVPACDVLIVTATLFVDALTLNVSVADVPEVAPATAVR